MPRRIESNLSIFASSVSAKGVQPAQATSIEALVYVRISVDSRRAVDAALTKGTWMLSSLYQFSLTIGLARMAMSA